MEEDKYTYKNPLDQGYTQFKLTKKQHNKLFPMRKKTWRNKYEYYYNEHGVQIHQFASLLVIIIGVVLFPFYVLINGLVNVKEILIEYRDAFNQKKYGSFISDFIWNNTEKYNKIIKIIRKENNK